VPACSSTRPGAIVVTSNEHGELEKDEGFTQTVSGTFDILKSVLATGPSSEAGHNGFIKGGILRHVRRHCMTSFAPLD
jgi:hypothetical protein